jgi:hypothetical protein
MKIYELMGCSRSGHHTVLNWLIMNHVGFQCEWTYKMNNMANTGFYILSEANHDIPLGLKFIQEELNNIDTLFVGYEDTPSNYTIFNEDKIYKGPVNLEYRKKYEIEHKGRIILIRDFYDNLSSRLKSNEKELFVTWDSGTPFLMDVAEHFIFRWKSQARSCVEKKSSFLRFEDWLQNKEIRDKFLLDNFGLKDMYGTKEIRGTQSSFGSIENVTKRTGSVEIPEETKELIRKDSELHYLIGALGYEYKSI